MTDDLIALALDLTSHEAGRPKQTSIRRAISTAYYAVFHALSQLFADEVAGSGARRDPAYASIYRFLDHGPLLKLLTDSKDNDIKRIGAIFKTLQESRKHADYDPMPFRVSREEAQELIIQAKEAVIAVRALKPKQRLAVTAALLSYKRR